MRFIRILHISSIFIICFLNFFSLIHGQQLYAARATTNCTNKENSVLGYTCNGLNTTCQAFLIFRSQPPYTTVSSISTLLNSDPSRLSAINSVPETATFDTNKQVIVPVSCSCSGSNNYSQANTSYVVKAGDAPFSIANNTYQGLSTCQAIQDQNRRSTVDIFPGDRLNIPVRCACPSRNQTDLGIKYLLSYIITWEDSVNSISMQFGAETARTLEANQIEEQDTIYPFTTLLVPLQNPPSSNQTAEPPTTTSPPPPPPPPPPSSDNSSSKTWIYVLVGLLGGIALTAFIGSIIFFAVFRRGRKRSDPVVVSEIYEAKEKPLNKKLDEESQDFLDDISGITHSLKVYKFKELEAATDNFSTSCWIRGSVYRGLIKGDYAAIKKINGDVSKEIDLLNKINHFNLVRLSGVCFSDGQWYLVYEYADNGALSDWIYSSNSDGKFLNWTQRMQVASDVATGLNYLHSFASPPHVHKDIKSSNILLDSDFRAKIANLAMARAAEGEFTLTRHIVGTKGYMAPEYLENGLISTKLDVYAFGILILEIVTGKEVAALYTEENLNLSDMVSNVLSQKDIQESIRQFIDPSLDGDYSSELSVYVMRLIDSCLNKNPADRPAMDEIVQSLSRILTLTRNWESSSASGNTSFSRSS